MIQRDFKEELELKKIIELKDFAHAELYNSYMVMDTNRCVIYPEAGLFLFKDDKQIVYVEGTVETISHTGEHYYIKVRRGRDDISLYLTFNGVAFLDRKPVVETKVGDYIVLQEKDIPFNLTMFYKSHKKEFLEQESQIIHDLGWEVIKVIENKILQIQKESNVKYVSISNAINLKEIKIHGEELISKSKK